MKCCIVIPVYKEHPTKQEIAALQQVITVLNGYKIFLVCAKQFNPIVYTTFFEHNQFSDFAINRFSNRYFGSLSGYNNLLLSLFFFRRFRSYEYMLIYQLDAWIFKNELEYWCNQNYDYVGAPWFEGFEKATASSVIKAVGNGGFSLRKISSSIKVLTSFAVIRPYGQLWNTLMDKVTPKSVLAYLLRITVLNNTFFLMNDYSSQEDHFWGLEVSKKFNWFSVPDPMTASKFAVEVNAKQLYEMNGKTLPFGCHAWERYDPVFWREFITV